MGLDCRIFMLVSRICELDAERADLGAVEQRQQPGQWEVVGVRAFPISPADVQSDLVARDAIGGSINCFDVQLHRIQELGVTLILKHARAF